MLIRIVVDADDREAEFVRSVPRPPCALADTPQQRQQRLREALAPALTELYAEARTWLSAVHDTTEGDTR